jgi:hypothetical protein
VDHFLYSDQLARLIGCYPQLWRLFFSSPRRWSQAVSAPWNGCQFWLNDPKHHERIFETFQRYHDNRISQVWVFLVLAPILPLIALLTYLHVFFREHVVFESKTRVDEDGARHREILGIKSSARTLSAGAELEGVEG